LDQKKSGGHQNFLHFRLPLPLPIGTTGHADGALASSVFLDHLQILPQLDPAAIRQKAAEIYAGINHAIATDNRTGIDDRIATDLGSVTDDCAEFS
jgi:hypothetical protein